MQQRFLQLELGKRFHAREDVRHRRGEEVELVLCGRQLVVVAGQHGAHAAVGIADLADGVNDLAVCGEDDVAVLAHELEHERLRREHAARANRVDVDEEQAIEAVLTDGGDAPRLDLLAQHHAEHGRLRRILERLQEQVRGGVRGIRRDVQEKIPPGLADGEDDRLLVRLRDLVDAPARERAVELARERMHGKAVEAAHRLSPESFILQKISSFRKSIPSSREYLQAAGKTSKMK